MVLQYYRLQGQAKQMESNINTLLKEIKMMSIKERYQYKKLFTELFEEKEIVYLDTDRFGRISMLQWHNKEPYQVYRCNQHKNVELAYHGCHWCTHNFKRSKEEEEDKQETELEKNLQELLE